MRLALSIIISYFFVCSINAAENIVPREEQQNRRIAPNKATKTAQRQAEREAKEKAAREEVLRKEKLAAERLQEERKNEQTQIEINREQMEINRATARFNRYLVIIGALQLLVAGAAAYAAYRATDAANRSADTARSSTAIADRQTSLIFQNERAWITVKPQQPEYWPLPQKQSISYFPLMFSFLWSATNVGRTPAFIKELTTSCRIRAFPQPNEAIDYDYGFKTSGFVIPPNGDHTERRSCLISATDYDRIFRGELCVVFYGYIQYNDTLEGKDHISRDFRVRPCSHAFPAREKFSGSGFGHLSNSVRADWSGCHRARCG